MAFETLDSAAGAAGDTSPGAPDSQAARRHRRRLRTRWLVVAAAVLGLVAGAAADRHHTAQVQRAEARQRLGALALLQSVSSIITGYGTVAELNVQVYNSGKRPFDVQVSPEGATTEKLRIQVPAGSRTVQPGQALGVVVALPIDCTASAPPTVAIPVQVREGGEQQLAVRYVSGVPLDQSAQQALCEMMPDLEQLSASLLGTLTHPVLQLSNGTDSPLTVGIDSGSPLTEAFGHRLSFRTVPRLPLTLRPRATSSVRVEVGVPGCIIGSNLPDLSRIGYLELRGDDTHGVQVTGAGVDVGPLIGGAIARSCD
ncbi:hypothetical protein ACPPVT_21395 [Angustibacter sp. McL0619]|uniref:hypothetical protein n=1 Tax=Angustibacter sp. McL0619 TaxID=3415676 RepID=UPI003CF170A8